MENWRKIKDFDNYSVSDKGNVRNDKKGTLLRHRISTSGYPCLILPRAGKHYMKYIHRMVGEAFIPNPQNLPQIDHIDGTKTNNAVSNLRWVSVSENYRAYGYEQRAESRKREVLAIYENGEKILFPSRLAVADHFHCCPAKVKYGYTYVKGSKKGWTFYKVEDIV